MFTVPINDITGEVDYSTHDVAQNSPIERPAATVQILALPFNMTARNVATIGARLR